MAKVKGPQAKGRGKAAKGRRGRATKSAGTT